MDGMDSDAVSSVSTLPLLAVSVQFCAPEVSPNFNVPMLREPSSVTARFAEMLTVLKSAVLPAPSAARPLLHLVVSLQLPLALAVHVPALKITGSATVTTANALAPAASVTRAVNTLVPTSLNPGVPVSVPLVEMVSHAGPLALL